MRKLRLRKTKLAKATQWIRAKLRPKVRSLCAFLTKKKKKLRKDIGEGKKRSKKIMPHNQLVTMSQSDGSGAR